MGLNTKIEWTATVRADGTTIPGHTANLWWGCTNVHEGCDNCYAERLAHRYGTQWGNDAPRKMLKKSLKSNGLKISVVPGSALN